METTTRDLSRVRQHFEVFLTHCPVPAFIVDPSATTLLACTASARAHPGDPLENIFSESSLAGLRALQGVPGESRAIRLERISEAGRPLNSTAYTVSCEDIAGEPRYILIESQHNPAENGIDAAKQRPFESRESDLRQQELRFRALADSVPVGIFLTNPDGRVMYVNGLWSLITGLTSNQAMVRGWLSALHPDDRGRVQHAWQRFVARQAPFEAEFRCVAGDTTNWVSARAAIFTNETGVPAGFLGTFADVTAQHETADRLKQNEARYRSIFENVIDVYYETSLTGEILEVSPSIDALGGYTRAELLGQQMLSFYADPGARAKLLEKLVEGGGGLHDYEIALRDKDGRSIACSVSCKLDVNENGEPIKIIGSMRDIGQRKAVEEMLRLERENLELIAKGEPLPRILESIVRSVEAQAGHMHCSVLLADPAGKRLRLGAAPGLPDAYNQAVDGIAIEDGVGCCGTAAATKTRIITEDISIDPRWAAFRDLALSHGLRACWSEPILSPAGRVLGTFTMYYSKTARPSREDLHLVDAAAQLAAVAIERNLAAEEQRNLESQVRQAQKLESLGVLAGGIAHDFNNLLTGILGYASLAASTLRETGSPAYRHVREIEKVAQRAAGLTKQMLAYSGKGRFLITPIDLSVSVEELAHLLSISISKKARLHYDFQHGVPLVEADPAQVQQVVMNLITNASEALGDQSGDITIATGVIAASPEYLTQSHLDSELRPGDYVYVDVIDTGCGMDKETLARIFDPFFTTKFTGRGLGMSAVLGIMKGHRGTIKIASEPGYGTTVRLLFPALARSAELTPEAPLITDVIRRDTWSGNGTILVVDDEATIRGLAAAILAEDGFKVLTAIDGEQALDVYRRHSAEIDAILLDLTMPVKDGIETLRELRAGGSEVAVILSSGYNEQEVAKRISGDRFEAFVQKPYSRETLLACMREVLAAR